ncbi:MAG: formate/nitrite transporter family protein [Anaerolineaceae bacterium]|nr:formate/nitrite transporter family protein [Anaerolineaceae bacterium]
MTLPSMDSYKPAEMAERAAAVGDQKAKMNIGPMFLLACLAGAFIAMGAIFATTAAAGTCTTWPFGVTRALMGLVFCTGLVLVVVGGAELFTGNTLMTIACLEKRITTGALLRNWVVVYTGNLVGSLVTALLTTIGRTYTFGDGILGTTALSIANAKVNLDFWQAVALGILCNFLVCLAIWMTFSARTVTGRILAVIFPISAFVAAGFEHSVANMYFIPAGLFIKLFDPLFSAGSGLDLGKLTWGGFFIDNLLPVTIGNLIGGAVLVGMIYWAVYLRGKH